MYLVFVLCLLSSTMGILWDQMGPQTNTYYESAYFSSNFVHLAADDFIIPSGTQWLISNISVVSVVTSFNIPSNITITIYDNENNLPGVVLYNRVFAPSNISPGTLGTFTFDLMGSNWTLQTGRYWFVVAGVFLEVNNTNGTFGMIIGKSPIGFMGSLVTAQYLNGQWSPLNFDLIFSVDGNLTQVISNQLPSIQPPWILPVEVAVPVVVGIIIILASISIVLLIWRRRRNSFKTVGSMRYLTNVKINQIIGSGNFGKVYLGTWEGTQVALKTINFEDQPSLEEIQLLRNLHHPNIVQMYGLFSTPSTTYMVLEYCRKGSVIYLLLSEGKTLSVIDLLEISYSAALGMIYLSISNILHNDLSARNLLIQKVDEHFIVKVADFGMAKYTNNNIYESVSQDRVIPVRWSAPEIIVSRSFTTKSDVWSFGVTMFEIFSLGKIPYENLQNVQVIEKIPLGHREERPEMASDSIYNLLEQCWQLDPNDRPDFQMIADTLSEQIRLESSGTNYSRYSQLKRSPSQQESTLKIPLDQYMDTNQYINEEHVDTNQYINEEHVDTNDQYGRFLDLKESRI